MIYNDYPITNSEADKLGRAGFAKSVAKAIVDYTDDNSISIGLCGEWGSGKTSTLNLIEKEIVSSNSQQKTKHKNVVIKFNPWNFTNQDQLLEQFFKFLKKELQIVDFSEVVYRNGVVYEKISKAAKVFSFLPFVGKLSKLIGDYGEALKSFKSDKSLDEIKSKINKRLEKQKRKFIVFIDDIDRLSDHEIAQMFQLVKLIADFKNIIYVLSFDKKVVVSALKKVQPDFADQYLEKIIQIPFELPAADKKKIQEMLFERLNATIKDLPDLSKHRISRLYMTGVYDTFQTLRNVKRFINNFEFSYLPLKKEVDFIDFFVIRYIEIFHFDVYKKLHASIKKLIGNFSPYYSYHGDNDREKKEVVAVIGDVLTPVKEKEQKELLTKLLEMIFPKVNTALSYNSYGGTTTLEDKYAGRIYADEKYRLYFELSVSNEDVSTEEMSDMLSCYESAKIKEYVKKLYELGTAGVFIRYVYTQLEKNPDIPYGDILVDLFEIFYSIDNSQKISLFEVNNNRLILLLLKEFLLKQKDEGNIIAYLKNIKGKIPLGACCEAFLTIGFNIGKFGDKQTAEDKKISLSIPEFETLDKELETQIFEQLDKDYTGFNYNEFTDIIRYACRLDCDALSNWVKKNIKSDKDEVVKFLNLCMFRSLMESDDRYVTYSYMTSMLTNVIYPMNWDNLVKEFISSESFESSDKDFQRAAIIYFLQNKPRSEPGAFTDRQIFDYYKNEMEKDFIDTEEKPDET